MCIDHDSQRVCSLCFVSAHKLGTHTVLANIDTCWLASLCHHLVLYHALDVTNGEPRQSSGAVFGRGRRGGRRGDREIWSTPRPASDHHTNIRSLLPLPQDNDPGWSGNRVNYAALYKGPSFISNDHGPTQTMLHLLSWNNLVSAQMPDCIGVLASLKSWKKIINYIYHSEWHKSINILTFVIAVHLLAGFYGQFLFVWAWEIITLWSNYHHLRCAATLFK